MLTKLCVLVLVCVCSSSSSNALDFDPLRAQNQQLMNMLMSSYASNSRASADAQVEDCFEYYTKAERQVSETYNAQYMGCIRKSATDKNELAKRNARERTDITNRENQLCSSLQYCQTAHPVALDFFRCTGSTANTNELLKISGESEKYAADIQREMQRIEDDEKICVVDAKTLYHTDMATVMKNLDKCLNEGWIPPTEAPPLEPENSL